MQSNTTGYSNVAIGGAGVFTAAALQNNTEGYGNIAIGAALTGNTTGTQNVAIGRTAMYSGTTGSSNVAIGQAALTSNTTAGNNTAVGFEAGYSTTTGVNNTFMGENSGYLNTTGDRSSYYGSLAGQTTTGRANTFIGCDAGYLVTTGANNTILGRYNGNQGSIDIRTASNYIVLSDGDGNPRMWIAGTNGYFIPNIRSSATPANDLRFNTGNGEIYYQTSSQRYKTNIVDLEFDTSNIYNLRPVSFDDKETGERCYGLIAEETFEQIPELVVTREIDGETVPDSIPYSMLSVAILNEMKKLKAELEDAKARITALEGA
jgi:hypothetical protein